MPERTDEVIPIQVKSKIFQGVIHFYEQRNQTDQIQWLDTREPQYLLELIVSADYLDMRKLCDDACLLLAEKLESEIFKFHRHSTENVVIDSNIQCILISIFF